MAEDNVEQIRTAPGYRMAASGDAAEIFLYGMIGDSWFGDSITAEQFKNDLKNLGNVKTIDLRINSDGGDVFQAQTMYSLLQAHKAKVTTYVDGLAASAASVVCMAGSQIRIAEGAFIMIHNPWTMTMGGAADLRKQADLLDQITGSIVGIYTARTGKSANAVRKMMDDETWMAGPDAVKNGFADVMVENMKVAAAVRDAGRFRNLPASLRPNRAAALRLISR